MYIKSLTYRNLGPLKSIDISLPFDKEGLPKPLLIVGENGSGKSLLMANLVDSLIEAAAVCFDNVRPNAGGMASQYFKTIRPIEVSLGQEYLAVHISFDDGNEYVFKSGKADFNEVKDSLHIKDSRLDWGERQNYKKTTFNKKESEALFGSSGGCVGEFSLSSQVKT